VGSLRWPIPSILAAHVMIEGLLVLFLEIQSLGVASLSAMGSLGRRGHGRIATRATIDLRVLRMMQ
jgi:hypothetical protein